MMVDLERTFPVGPWLDDLVRSSLAEDRARDDVTSGLCLAPGLQVRGVVTARQQGVVAGLPLLAKVFAHLDPAVEVKGIRRDGDTISPGDVVAELAGPALGVLGGERTALNFLQNLSGIASLTSTYVAAIQGTACHILDTRKTLPGYRELAKYAVRCGGGHNHRLGLHDRIMFKDNHWLVAQAPLAELVARGRREYPKLVCEVEVDGLKQLQEVLPLSVEWILLDNFILEDVRTAVAMRDGLQAKTRLEVSGNVSLANVADYASTGVDAISVGRLTHSAPALDLGLDLDLGPDLETLQ